MSGGSGVPMNPNFALALLRARADVLLKDLRSDDPARRQRAAERLCWLPQFAPHTVERVLAEREAVKQKPGLTCVAREVGFETWEALKAAADAGPLALAYDGARPSGWLGDANALQVPARPVPCYRIEFDLDFFGGDYGDSGERAYIPCHLVRDADFPSLQRAFRDVTGHDPVHIVSLAWDELVTQDGDDWDGDLFGDANRVADQLRCAHRESAKARRVTARFTVGDGPDALEAVATFDASQWLERTATPADLAQLAAAGWELVGDEGAAVLESLVRTGRETEPGVAAALQREADVNDERADEGRPPVPRRLRLEGEAVLRWLGAHRPEVLPVVADARPVGGETADAAAGSVPADDAATVDPALFVPRVGAEVHTDDQRAEAAFDAARWFARAADDEIRELAAIGWGGGYASDDLARFMEDHDPAVKRVFEYHDRCRDRGITMPWSDDPVGFECHVTVNDAAAWLRMHRPTLAESLAAEGRFDA